MSGCPSQLYWAMDGRQGSGPERLEGDSGWIWIRGIRDPVAQRKNIQLLIVAPLGEKSKFHAGFMGPAWHGQREDLPSELPEHRPIFGRIVQAKVVSLAFSWATHALP